MTAALEERVLARMRTKLDAGAYGPLDVDGLWEHQAEAVRWLESHYASLLYLGMGSGKTRVAARSFKRTNALPALVLTRSKVIEDGIWERECVPLGLDVIALTGPITGRANMLAQRLARDSSFVALTNYEGAWREPLRTIIDRAPWMTVVADESHHLKSAGSKISMFAKKLGRALYRIGLSGTPMAHSPLDLYGQFRFLSPDVYGSNYKAFQSRYAVMGGFEGRQVIGLQRQDELMRKFWSVAFNQEPSFTLEEPLDVYLFHDLPKDARTLYKELDSEFWAQVGKSEITVANAAVKVLRLQQVAAGHVKDDAGSVSTTHTARADSLAEWLEDAGSEPVVVFCRFRHDLEEIGRVCDQLSLTHGEVSGKVDNLQEWKEGKTQILATQIQAGGEGIDLTRSALAAYYTVGYSLSDYLQSRARLVRPGQTRAVRFYHFEARSTVDQRIYKALKNKEDVIQSLLTLKGNR